jgi:hypothetical protein
VNCNECDLCVNVLFFICMCFYSIGTNFVMLVESPKYTAAFICMKCT